MTGSVGVRELRQNLSKHLDRVKAGEDLVVTERGEVVARIVPAGGSSDAYAALSAEFGASVPVERLQSIAKRLNASPRERGTTDAFIAEDRADRTG